MPPALRPLLAAVYHQVQRTPTDLPSLHAALYELLRFLASSDGRTNANCCAADLFFMHNDRWERDWEHLPEPYQDLLGHLSEALHDTVSHAEIARNFGCTPEQLLEQLARINPTAAAV